MNDAKDKYTREWMQLIGGVVKEVIPEGYGFFVFVFPFGDEHGRSNYISNGNREDVIQTMKEFIKRNEHNEDWMTHQDEGGDSG